MIPEILAVIRWDEIIDKTAPNIGSAAKIGDIVGGKGYFPGLTTFLFFIAGMLLIVYLLYGGFLLMTSDGNPKSVESGKQVITNALSGFAIVFVSYWIVQFVGLFLGLDALNNVF